MKKIVYSILGGLICSIFSVVGVRMFGVTNVMWVIGLIAGYLLALGVFLFGLYLWGRMYVPKFAEKDRFFSSPKPGRIKARRRSGRIVGFYDNLINKGKHVDEVTGRIEDEAATPEGFWWNWFGVRFIGLDDVHKYTIARGVTEVEKDKLEYDEIEASSIFHESNYPLTLLLLSVNGIVFRVKFNLRTTTVNAATALSLNTSWTIPVFAAVIGACREHFGARQASDLISSQNEGDKVTIAGKEVEYSGFVDRIKSLNGCVKGNPGLAETCGQYIDAINIVDIDFASEEDRETFMAPYVAEQAAQEEVKKAGAYAEALKIKTDAELLAADAKATATTKLGDALASNYAKKHAALGGNPQATAEVMVAELQGPLPNIQTYVKGVTPAITIPSGK